MNQEATGSGMDHRDRIEAAAEPIRWFHSIDLGHGFVTKGFKSAEILQAEAQAILGPIDLSDRSVADIGAWNGFFSVECKRRGARRIVAVDHLVWVHPHFRGRESIELVRDALGVDIELDQRDIADTSVATIGEHDVILLLGVFYHLFDVQTDLRRISQCARDLLILETHQDAFDRIEPAMIFYPGDTLNNDASNWWGPNPQLVHVLLKEFGFEKIYYRPHPVHGHLRGVYHAFRTAGARTRYDVSLEAGGSIDLDTLVAPRGRDGRVRGPFPWTPPAKPAVRNIRNFFRFITKRSIG